MSRLRVHLLGGMTVFAGSGRSLLIARSCRSIVGYLIAHRHRRISRDELAETLWSEHDGDHARRCLSTALWRLKKATGSDPALLIFRGTDEVSFNWQAPVWVDSVALELRVQPLLRINADALATDTIGRLQRGLRLYKGDYLKGIDDEWAWLERERLRNLYLDGLYHLMVAYAAKSDWIHVLEWGRRLNQEEPLREDVHRLLMRAYACTGNRAKAIVQYQRCQCILQAELGVEPMAETQALYRELLHSNKSSAESELSVAAPTLTHVSRRIAGVRRVLTSSRRQIDLAIESLTQADLPQADD